jgi:hypothetical protein
MELGITRSLFLHQTQKVQLYQDATPNKLTIEVLEYNSIIFSLSIEVKVSILFN